MTDDARRLVGMLGLRDLVLAPPDARVGDLMDTDVFSARVDSDQEEVARLIREADLLAIPIVDSEDRLVGIVTVDDAMEVLVGLADVLAETVDLAGMPQVFALFAAIAFFLGFAPPTWIRRAWREPDLRNFLERSIHLPTVTDERRAVVEIQNAAAGAFGAAGASIGLAVPGRPILRYVNPEGEWIEYPDDAFIAGTAFASSAGWLRSMLPRPIRSMPTSTSGTSQRRSSPSRPSAPTSVRSASCRSMRIVRRSSSRTTCGCSS